MRVSRFKGTIGMENVGRPPATLAKSPTLGMGISKLSTKPVLNKIATSVEGNTLENLGNIQITIIVITTIQ